MKSKLKFILPILLLAAGGAYKFVLAKPAAEAKPKVHGEVYILPKEFLVNLADERFAKLNVAMVLPHGTAEEAAAAAGHGGAAPEGFGALPQEALVRDLITDELTNAHAEDLISRKGRKELKEDLVKEIRKHSDVKVQEVLFTDVAVQ